ncbi:MAG: hypothetical protein ABSG86_23435 [Thermoguttaceae bacterium]|jgi:hypothetical protein
MPRPKGIGPQPAPVRARAAGRRKVPPGRLPDGVLVLVQRPRRWRPASEWDMPRRAVVIEVVHRPTADPATYVRQYNAVSLDESGTTWAAWAPATPTVGTEAELLSPR